MSDPLFTVARTNHLGHGRELLGRQKDMASMKASERKQTPVNPRNPISKSPNFILAHSFSHPPQWRPEPMVPTHEQPLDIESCSLSGRRMSADWFPGS